MDILLLFKIFVIAFLFYGFYKVMIAVMEWKE